MLVLGRNPARIRADFEIPLGQPRDPRSQEFVLYVDYVYHLITQPLAEAVPLATGTSTTRAHQVLPNAKPGAIAGFLELLNSRGGRQDLYRIAGELSMQVDDLLPIVEAATLLAFLKSERGDVELTSEGRGFVHGHIAERKALFRMAALSRVTLLQQMHRALQHTSDHTLPLEFFRDVLEKHVSEPEARSEIETH